MRYPLLTKLLSVGLCICCLAMLVSGIYGADKAGKDRELENADLRDVNKKAEDYLSLDKALSGKITYAEAREDLESRFKEHKEASSEHKQQLTEYSATKGGLTMGSDTMTEAEYAMEDMKSYYEQAEAELGTWEKALPEFRSELENGREQYDTALALYNFSAKSFNGIRELLDRFYSLDGMMGSGDSNISGDISLEACDGLIRAYEDALSFVWELEAKEIVSSERLHEIESGLIDMTGMNSVDILNLLYKTRDDIASGTAEGLTEEQFLVIKGIYDANRGLLMAAAASAEEILSEAGEQLSMMGEQLQTAGAQLEEGEAMLSMALQYMSRAGEMMAEMKLAMEQGGEELIAARNEMNAKFGELDVNLEKLRAEKERLSNEAEELEELEAEADERRELENRRTSLSVNLRDVEEIGKLYDEGTELTEAVRIYSENKALSIEKVYRDTLHSCIYIIISALAGIAALLIVFGKKEKGRAVRIALPALCLILALIGECTAYFNSLGHIYSALTVSVIAALTLLAAIPNKKKKTISM